MMRSVGTLTRADLAETINRKMGLSRAESLDMVEKILDHMSDAMADGQNVKISGFGSFILRDKRQRIGRNPKTGVEVPITPRRVMTFRASQLLKEHVVDLLAGLSEREQKIIRMRFGLDDGKNHTLEEVGQEFQVTRERIRQIEAKALAKLRKHKDSKRMMDYIK